MILIMGPAGAGKSVQGRMLIDSIGYNWMSVGAILRSSHIDPNLTEQMNRGELLDNETVENLVAEALNQVADPQKVVLDGFPRDHHQAHWLVSFCEASDLTIDFVLHLIVDLEVAKKRLQSRGRDDDKEEVINKRFVEYEQISKPILQFLDEKGIEIVEIDANKTIDEVHEQITEVIKSVHQG